LNTLLSDETHSKQPNLALTTNSPWTNQPFLNGNGNLKAIPMVMRTFEGKDAALFTALHGIVIFSLLEHRIPMIPVVVDLTLKSVCRF